MHNIGRYIRNIDKITVHCNTKKNNRTANIEIIYVSKSTALLKVVGEPERKKLELKSSKQQ